MVELQQRRDEEEEEGGKVQDVWCGEEGQGLFQERHSLDQEEVCSHRTSMLAILQRDNARG